MGLFSKENCAICNNEVSALLRSKLKSGEYICRDCGSKVNFSTGWTIDNFKNSSVEEIKERIDFAENDLKENADRLSKFKATAQFGGYIWFDDKNKWFVFPKGVFTQKIDNCYVFKYDEILDYEVLEDGTSITKGGLGKAIVGGAIFGLAGAIAGGTSKKTKQVCNNLQIKVTTKNIDNPVIYINLINAEFNKNSLVYKQASKSVQDILSKFQIVIDQLEQEKNIQKEQSNTNTTSVADEIKKFKELLDMGAISQEEFDEKKKQLLGL